MQMVSKCPAKAFEVDRSVGELWTEYAAITPQQHSFEEVCHPKYFGALRVQNPRNPRPSDRGIRIGDIIHVRSEDRLWMARLVVREIPEGIDEVHTDVIEKVEFRAKSVPQGYQIIFRPHRQWCIYFNEEMIETGFTTEEQAGLRVQYFEEQRKAANRINEIDEKKTTRKSTAKKAEAPAEAAE